MNHPVLELNCDTKSKLQNNEIGLGLTASANQIIGRNLT